MNNPSKQDKNPALGDYFIRTGSILNRLFFSPLDEMFTIFSQI